MSEADTSNNPPLPSSEPNVVEDIEEMPTSSQAVLNSFVLPEPGKAPVVQTPKIEEVASIASSTVVQEAGNTISTNDTATSRQASEGDWIALTKKLRQRNRSLFSQVNQLERSLAECQQALQSQQARSQAQETLLVQQSEEINTTQNQLTRLFRELEASHQVAQRQQILIETLSQQLENSQERIAQLERECAMTQQRYTEQSHQLQQTENTCQELHSRLQRQQRQTLQFKSALEKCLEVPAPNYEPNAEAQNSAWSQRHLKNILAAQSLLPKAQPIQPWSAEPELSEDNTHLDSPWDQPAPPQLRLVDQEAVLSHSQETDELEEDLTTEPSAEQQEAEADLLVEQSDLGWVYQLLDEPDADLLVESTASSTDEVNLEPLTQSPEERFSQEVIELPVKEESFVTLAASTDAWAETFVPEPPPRQQLPLSQPNWPSPVVYPLRSAKKLQSYAAIELPTFPRYRS
jgi:hypothetical protein